LFTDICQRRLPPRLCTDHFSILLDCGDAPRGSRSFKFENRWLKAKGFVYKVKQCWDSYLFQRTPNFVLACKLKALKIDLKRWNEEVFGNVERKKKILLEELHVFYVLEEGRVLGVEKMRKAAVVNELERSTLMEEVS
jgi:hypothetical protein